MRGVGFYGKQLRSLDTMIGDRQTVIDDRVVDVTAKQGKRAEKKIIIIIKKKKKSKVRVLKITIFII